MPHFDEVSTSFQKAVLEASVEVVELVGLVGKEARVALKLYFARVGQMAHLVARARLVRTEEMVKKDKEAPSNGLELKLHYPSCPKCWPISE
jgi:hypothetical protein